MKHKILKLLLINFLLLIVSVILVQLLTNLFLISVFNAIFGSEVRGVYAANVFMRFCLIAITTISFCLTNAKDEEMRRRYLNTIEGEQYQAKKDVQSILKDKVYWAECVICAVLFVFLFLFVKKPVWMFLLGIPIFAIIDFLWRMHLHKTWANSRMRIARSENADQNR